MKYKELRQLWWRRSVAPVRERGLKFFSVLFPRMLVCSRSRKGAWIEIYERGLSNDVYFVAPVRERRLKWWYCSCCHLFYFVAPVRERGLKSLNSICIGRLSLVAPVRERGLKLPQLLIRLNLLTRRSRKGAWIEI